MSFGGWLWRNDVIAKKSILGQCRGRFPQFRDVAGMSRYTPPKSGVEPVFPPPCRGVRSVLER